jgi:hypothetical protein
MVEKVVYLSYQPLTLKFFKDFYIQNCIDNNIVVEYWDMTQLFYPQLKFGNTLNSDIVIPVNSYKDFKLRLSNVDVTKTLFTIHINYRYNVIRLFILLTKFNCKLIFFGRGASPILPKKMSSKLIEVILNFDSKRFLMGIGSRLAKLLKYLKIVKTYDVIFNAGSEGYNVLGAGNFYDYKSANIVEINYYDYDLYLASANEKRLIESDYCVFLDEYLPHHPDFEIVNSKTIDESEYYPQLNKYLDYIEKKYNLKVVIAAHPKAFKYKSENPFNNRLIVFSQTCLLTRDAEFVMTSHSTSLSFALFYKKPLIFITSVAQKKKMYLHFEFTNYLATILNCTVVLFDNFNDYIIIRTVDQQKYDDYKYKYLTSKISEKSPSNEIFISSIQQLEWK